MKKYLSFFLALIMVLSLAPMALAEGEAAAEAEVAETVSPEVQAKYEEALALFKEGEYFDSFMLLRKTAEENHPASLHLMALLYYHGLGVEEDVQTAFEYLNRAAELDYIEAILDLGLLYENGYYLQKDYPKSLELYTHAAELGSTEAMNYLGVLYRAEHGATLVERDYASAMSWFEKAAGLGDPYAMCAIAELYLKGHGVEADELSALDWYLEAAALDYAPAMCALADMFLRGIGVQVNEDKAQEWLDKALAVGSSLPYHYLFNKADSDDYDGRLQLAEKAAELGDPELLYQLGYADSEEKSGLDLLIRAAEMGHSEAARIVWIHYNNAEGDYNKTQADEWYSRYRALEQAEQLARVNYRGSLLDD